MEIPGIGVASVSIKVSVYYIIYTSTTRSNNRIQKHSSLNFQPQLILLHNLM